MSEKPDIRNWDLTDAELVSVLKNHGIERRSLMKFLGAGAALSLGSGTVAAKHGDNHGKGGSGPQGNAKIDPHFGYSSAEDQDLEGSDLEPQHNVELHIAESMPHPYPFHFDPMGIHIEEGDIIRFDYESPDHTITAFHLGHGRQQRVPDGDKAFSSPVIPFGEGGFWLYDFDSPGVYDIYCAPHEFLGMVGRIVVGEPGNENFDDEFSEVGRPPVSRPELDSIPGLDASKWPFPVPAETFANESMSVSNIVAEGEVRHGDL